MALYMVSYDLDKPGQNYPALIKRLQEFLAQRILFSQWLMVHTASPEAIRNDLQRFMDANDRIIVSELKNHAAWQGLMISNEAVQALFNNAT
jgi:hypothetical protein